MNMSLSNSELVSELGRMVHGEVIDVNHPDYNKQVKRVWNARLFNKKPLMFVMVESQNDISQTLSFCKKNKVFALYHILQLYIVYIVTIHYITTCFILLIVHVLYY